MLTSHDSDEPNNVNETLNSPTREFWIKIMQKDIESMKNNHV